MPIGAKMYESASKESENSESKDDSKDQTVEGEVVDDKKDKKE